MLALLEVVNYALIRPNYWTLPTNVLSAICELLADWLRVSRW